MLLRLLTTPLLLLVLCMAPAAWAASTLTLERALTAAGAGSSFPTDAPGLEVALPDEWARTRPGHAGPLWYRLHVTPPDADDGLRALYIPRLCTNFEVQLNGHPIYSGGRMQPPLTHNCNHPQLVQLPAALLHAGSNVLDIKLVGQPLARVGSRYRAGQLSALEVGPLADMSSRHARDTALKVGLPQALGATLVLMGSFMFVMGATQRRDSHLAYFGALSVGWALADVRLWLRELPLTHTLAEFALATLLPFIALAAVQFLLRYARTRVYWVDVLMPLQCALVPLTLIVAGPSRLHTMVLAWELLLALQVAAAAAVFLKTTWRQREHSFGWMAAMLLAVAITGAIEFAAQLGLVQGPLVHLALLVPPMLMVIVGLRLVQQHGHALVQAEAGKAHLEQRIREATAVIERNFRQMSELRVEQVTERERKRIAADLHDDLGAKLLTIVHTSESDRISTLAREALEEMRLSVRGLSGRAVLLVDALGDWRVEVVSRLGQAGIECEWAAPEDLELPQRLSARAYVQTTRILREATSNIIKHSRASHCSLRCTVAEGDFQMVIRDNGNGIAADAELRLDRGHGLASMKSRAKQLQGQCLVESGPGYGTVIRLTLPMDQAVAEPGAA
jgi:two-component system, NarL family, sensor histidine kinase UhpB